MWSSTGQEIPDPGDPSAGAHAMCRGTALQGVHRGAVTETTSPPSRWRILYRAVQRRLIYGWRGNLTGPAEPLSKLYACRYARRPLMTCNMWARSAMPATAHAGHQKWLPR